jgi:hypothetical protein
VSKVRIIWSTPPVAMTVSRYLFQSWVRASDGRVRLLGFVPKLAPGTGAAPWIGINWTKWLEAEAGVRRSKMRIWLSDETDETMDAECGENAVE